VSHHRIAVITIAAALVLDTACGVLYAFAERIAVWHGLYCALADGVTRGGDVAPSTPAGYWISAVECVLVVPLIGATFSLFTSGLTSVHVRSSEKRVKAHLEQRLAEDHRSIHQRLDDMEREAK
jgi:hypothetical protein